MYIFSSILTASGTGGNLSYAGPPGDSGTVNRKKHTQFKLFDITGK
jgi:hypothetical protein